MSDDNQSRDIGNGFDYFENRMDALEQRIYDLWDALKPDMERLDGSISGHRSELDAIKDQYESRLELAEASLERRKAEVAALEKKFDSRNPLNFGLNNLLFWAMTFFIVVFAAFSTGIRIVNLLDTNDISANADGTVDAATAEQVLQRADAAVSSVELVLSFLEGASVLAALAIATATIYGFRQTNQVREELQKQVRDIQDREATVKAELAKINQIRPDLDELATIKEQFNDSTSDLKNTIGRVGKLLQADQEFRLGNHKIAYRFINEVLAEEDENPLALYLAGWIETQFIDGQQDNGIQHLEKLLKIEQRWPSATAAYAVALRRKAMRERDKQAPPDTDLMNTARGYFYQALGSDNDLVDFNKESYWGPLGGLLRDVGEIDAAIFAYEQALRITPGSSYPAGNLASLKLLKARDNRSLEEEALHAFQLTVTLAQAELAQKPNDYFLLMDMAMSYAILGMRDHHMYAESERNLQAVIDMRPGNEHLEVSMRGWLNLLEYMPRRPEWFDTRKYVQSCLDRITAMAEAAKKPGQK